MGFLKNCGNSCYMDSVLFILLNIPSQFIKNNILTKNVDPQIKTIQSELNTLKSNFEMSGITFSCSRLKKLLSPKAGFEGFSSDLPKDVDEFLKYIFNIFNVEPFTIITKIYGTNSIDNKDPLTLTSTNKNTREAPIIDINCNDPKTNLLDILKTPEDSGMLDTPYKADNGKYYFRRLQCSTYVNFTYIVFNIKRLSLTHSGASYNRRFSTKVIIPPKTVNNKILRAIIVWMSGHYYIYFNTTGVPQAHLQTGVPAAHLPVGVSAYSTFDKSEYCKYDDLIGISPIGTYEDVIGLNDVKTHSVMFFYF